MTLSIEDLPAPLGPMMARISPLRTSKLTSVNAFTPPNASEMLSTESRTSPSVRVAVIVGRRLKRTASASDSSPSRLHQHFRLADRHIGADDAGAAILELDRGLDELRWLPRIQRVDQHSVLVGDEAAPHLARTGEFVVIGI